MKRYKKYYTIDRTKTSYDNVLEMLKIIMPVELSISKMSGLIDKKIVLYNVNIFPARKLAHTRQLMFDLNSEYFNCVGLYVTLPNYKRYRGRNRQRSIPVRNNKVCLTDLENNIKYLSLEYQACKEEIAEKEASRKAEEEDRKKILEGSNLGDLPQVSLYSRHNDRYSLWLSLELEQLKKLAPYINLVLRK
jgi:hypothetical protein